MIFHVFNGETVEFSAYQTFDDDDDDDGEDDDDGDDDWDSDCDEDDDEIWDSAEMQKAADPADISVLFFSSWC